MSNIIPFESFDSKNLPAYLQGTGPADINNDLTAHASAGFPVISIKGKTFAVVRSGERTVLTNPKDPDSPANYVDVVILKANKNTSKVFYIKGFQEGAESTKPDCYSNDGIKPDISVERPVSKTCAVCPHNQWGSKITDNGSKGKACQDSVRLAVATPALLNDPHLLRIPPASIKALGELGEVLKKRGGGRLGYNMVVTRIGFVAEEASPKLTFKPIGMLSDEAYKQVNEVLLSDVVQNILGHAYVGDQLPVVEAETPAAPAVEAPKVEAPVVEAKPVEKPKKPKAEPKPAAVDIEVPDLNLDDLNFDD